MSTKKVLLVEGKDDERVIKHLCGKLSGPWLDDVKTHDSVEKLLESIPVYLKAAGDGAIIGIVIDADTDIAARWQSLRDCLLRTGYELVPANPANDGTVLDPPAGAFLPRVGIWIMPDNQTTGILEDFLKFLVPPGSRLFEHVESSVASIPAGERQFPELAKSKALIHTWLAWQQKPGRPLGMAITAGYLDPTVAVQPDILIAWLKRLFNS